MDYCNALLIGIQQDLIAKLQRLQNSAARIVSRTRKYEHITPVLIKLHWLPIKFRIQFKVLLLVYKALNGLAPKYIKELLVPYKPRSHLRSETKGLLDEPRTRLKFGDRAFSISAPRLWNALPQRLKDSTSCQAFKKCLKTHLFRLAHWGVVDYDSNYDNAQRFWTFLWMEKALYKFQLLLLLLKGNLPHIKQALYTEILDPPLCISHATLAIALSVSFLPLSLAWWMYSVPSLL